jgi:histidinol-phosphate aminotransferase
MSKYWSPVVHRLVPYVPGEQPKQRLIKLNTNENPYPPSPLAIEAMQAVLGEELRLYPDPNGERVKQAVAELHGLDAAQVFVGNGSDEVLAHVFQALLKHGRPLLFPDVSYSFYPVYCELYGIDWRPVPVDGQFRIRVDDYMEPDAGGIIFPNPNAPTGCLLPLEEIDRLAAKRRDLVLVVDEAYVDFGGESAVALVGRHSNLLIVQTLSKSRSLAGLRVGFAMGHPALIDALNRVKNSFNSYPLDRVALAGAEAALRDVSHFERTRQAVIASRHRLAEGLNALGFEVLPSAANFLFARPASQDAGELQRALRESGVLVRHFSQRRIDRFLRITVGTDDECGTLLKTLESLVR